MGDQLPKFKAAAVQAAPVFLDREATVQKGCRLIEEAAENGAKLVVFPETWIPTYPYWVLTHSPFLATAERAATRKAFIELYKNAVEVPGPATEALCRAARKAGAYVIVGVNERPTDYRGTLYNTLVYISRDGELMGKHRKLVPTHVERTVWGQGDGSTLRVYNTDLGTLGGLICYEHQMTLAKYSNWCRGEQVHAAVWPGRGPQWEGVQLACRQYAVEGQCFVVVACGYLDAAAVPDTFPMKDRFDWRFEGGSAIIDPIGRYLAGPLYGKEGILYAELDFEFIIGVKEQIDGTGHYARPEVLSLLVNEERFAPLRTRRADGVQELRDELKALRAELKALSAKIEGGADGEAKAALDSLVRRVDESIGAG